MNEVYRSALVRPIPDDALSDVLLGVEACRDDATCDASDFAAQSCRIVIKSADFLFY